jgi:hypothetical protein
MSNPRLRWRYRAKKSQNCDKIFHGTVTTMLARAPAVPAGVPVIVVIQSSKLPLVALNELVLSVHVVPVVS